MDPKTIFWTIFFDHFIGEGGRQTISTQGGVGCSPAVLRERYGRQTVVTEGRVEDELLERRERWEIDVLVAATGLWSVH